MTAVSPLSRRARSLPPGRRMRLLWRRGSSLETRYAVLLALLGLVICVGVVTQPMEVPFTSLMLPLLLGSVFLGPRTLPWYVIYLMVLLTVSVARQEEITGRTAVATAVCFVMGLVVLVTSFQRSSLGVAGARGESMLVDLRDRILTQGALPELPGQWSIESALHSAGGTPFAGDFVVASRPTGTDRLEVVVVDVSGKGTEAGTRALLLSGAFGGLIGALEPEEFLAAANDYLLRQDWDEGFATAIHLSLDTATGDYRVWSAGHPPAVHRLAGSGRWQVLRSEGPVLGLIDGVDFLGVEGRIGPGDALLLYTDGMVEEPRRDIDLGIDRMLGAMESLVRGTWEGSAARLVTGLGSPDDDRAVVVVHCRA